MKRRSAIVIFLAALFSAAALYYFIFRRSPRPPLTWPAHRPDFQWQRPNWSNPNRSLSASETIFKGHRSFQHRAFPRDKILIIGPLTCALSRQR